MTESTASQHARIQRSVFGLIFSVLFVMVFPGLGEWIYRLQWIYLSSDGHLNRTGQETVAGVLVEAI